MTVATRKPTLLPTPEALKAAAAAAQQKALKHTRICSRFPSGARCWRCIDVESLARATSEVAGRAMERSKAARGPVGEGVS